MIRALPTPRFLTALAAVTFLAAPVSGVRAGEESRPAPPAGARSSAPAADAEKPLKFTNEDLGRRNHRRFVSDRTDPVPPPSAAPEKKPEPDAADKKPGDEKGTDEKAAARLRLQVTELQARLAQLREREKSLQNPYLRGLTESDEKEEEAVGGRRNDARLEWVRSQVKETEEAIRKARAELSTLARP